MTQAEFIKALQIQVATSAQVVIGEFNRLAGWVASNLPSGDGGGGGDTDVHPDTIYFHSNNGPQKPTRTKLYGLATNKKGRYTLGGPLADKWYPTEKDNIAVQKGRPQDKPWGKPPVINEDQTKWAHWAYIRVERDGARKKGMVYLPFHGHWTDVNGLLVKVGD